MDGISLPQPPTHPFLSAVKGQAKACRPAKLGLVSLEGPCSMLVVIIIPPGLDTFNANGGGHKFTTVNNPNFELEIIKICFKYESH